MGLKARFRFVVLLLVGDIAWHRARNLLGPKLGVRCTESRVRQPQHKIENAIELESVAFASCGVTLPLTCTAFVQWIFRCQQSGWGLAMGPTILQKLTMPFDRTERVANSPAGCRLMLVPSFSAIAFNCWWEIGHCGPPCLRQ